MQLEALPKLRRLAAKKLGITQAEYDGLIRVRDDLASGRVKHVTLSDGMPTEGWHDPYFNMQLVHGIADCGTAHCIGGFMQIAGVYPVGLDVPVGIGHPLGALFHPFLPGWATLTPIQAVRAIDHFFAGAGTECWPRAVLDVPHPTDRAGVTP